MMLLAGAAIFVGVTFAASIDTATVIDALLAETPVPPAQRDSMVSVANVLVALMPVLAAASVLLTLLAFGLSLWLVGKLLRDGSTFRTSMSLACWASLPGAIHSLAAIVAILLAPSDVSSFEDAILASATAPLNLGTLGVDPTFLGGVPTFYSLTDFWIAALVVIGYQRWYQTHIVQAAAVAIVPFALLAAFMFLPLSMDPAVESGYSNPAPTPTEPPFPRP